MEGARKCESTLWIACVLRVAASANSTGDGRVEIRVRDDILLLDQAVVTICGQNIRKWKAIVKDAVSCANHGFVGTRTASRRPCGCQARRKIASVVDVGLHFISQSKIDGQIRPHAPIVSQEHASIRLMHSQVRIAESSMENCEAPPPRARICAGA